MSQSSGVRRGFVFAAISCSLSLFGLVGFYVAIVRPMNGQEAILEQSLYGRVVAGIWIFIVPLVAGVAGIVGIARLRGASMNWVKAILLGGLFLASLELALVFLVFLACAFLL